jgi:dTDP-4-amino-4,6-dideoxygalactose transaminase
VTPLAVLGGAPAFPDGLAFARPPVPEMERVVARLAPSYQRGMLTNGPLVRELEAHVAERLGCRHAVAVSSCTAGLMLALRAVAPDGPVVVPSFTFSATVHAIAWNGLGVRFAECDPASFQIDLRDAARLLDGAGALVVVHVFGAPCAPTDVERLARDAGVPLVFDGAAALGARHGARAVGGFGDVEVFSLSPTKPVVAGEGGLVTTQRDDVAEAVRIGRDYANAGDYDTRFVGLNARMSELHAAVALESLADLDANHAARASIADRYRAQLEQVPGVRLQRVPDGDVPTWKDVTIAVDPSVYGVTRDVLVTSLRAEGVDTRRYFDPPVHRQRSHARSATRALPVTDRASSEVVSLPVYPSLRDADVDRIVAVVADVHDHREQITDAVTARVS